jgi:hypothetical protein
LSLLFRNAMEREPWFQPRRFGVGLTPITWQGACLTIVIMVVLLATVGVVVATVHDPATAVLTILVATGAELAVFIPFTCRHAKWTRD